MACRDALGWAPRRWIQHHIVPPVLLELLQVEQMALEGDPFLEQVKAMPW